MPLAVWSFRRLLAFAWNQQRFVGNRQPPRVVLSRSRLVSSPIGNHIVWLSLSLPTYGHCFFSVTAATVSYVFLPHRRCRFPFSTGLCSTPSMTAARYPPRPTPLHLLFPYKFSMWPCWVRLPASFPALLSSQNRQHRAATRQRAVVLCTPAIQLIFRALITSVPTLLRFITAVVPRTPPGRNIPCMKLYVVQLLAGVPVRCSRASAALFCWRRCHAAHWRNTLVSCLDVRVRATTPPSASLPVLKSFLRATPS
jgi:hypothetical protein